ncbi:hypothetical protein F9K91_16805 [Brucella tritici]|uniref:Uncharacterized protein n=1 Tax=Brucella tritici TaxID=94626 RepID=A0A6L3Y9Z1_9HYPH|nr:hypothetical protein F9K91_16805 [Brucella tritici]KAB2680781.1 hypothetical protein F9L08_20580 [Brucella tritici]
MIPGAAPPRAHFNLTGSDRRSKYLFRRIVPRKTASHFCWKCSSREDRARDEALYPSPLRSSVLPEFDLSSARA